MQKQVQPILRWFFIYENNYILCNKVETSAGNSITLYLVDKNATYKNGSFFEDINLKKARLEIWQTPDLFWEDKQYGEWIKTGVQNFTKLDILNKSVGYEKDIGRLTILKCFFSKNEILSKFNNDMTLNKKWKLKNKDETKNKLYLQVFNNVSTQKPIQTYLETKDLEKLYNSESINDS